MFIIIVADIIILMILTITLIWTNNNDMNTNATNLLLLSLLS